jgi:glycosyltransferase involved in cell wall biosynthesis
MTAPREAVTAIIPTRNRPALLRRSICSALRQERVDVDVVVVDDGSDLPVELRDLPCASRVKVLRHETSRGVSAARNSGLRAANTEFVAFLDDDDIWAPGKLRAQLDALASQSRAGWSCTGAVHVNSNLEPLFWHRAPLAADAMHTLATRGGIPGGGSGVLARADLSMAIGGFDERFSILADWDFYYRLGAASDVAPVDKPLVGYYVHSDSMFHDPETLVGELGTLVDKHALNEHPVQPDYPYWAIRLTLMAVRLRRYRTAGSILTSEVARRSGAISSLSHVARQVVRRLHPQSPRRPPADWANEDVTWLHSDRLYR